VAAVSPEAGNTSKLLSDQAALQFEGSQSSLPCLSFLHLHFLLLEELTHFFLLTVMASLAGSSGKLPAWFF
jgi:hypothetical protein